MHRNAYAHAHTNTNMEHFWCVELFFAVKEINAKFRHASNSNLPERQTFWFTLLNEIQIENASSSIAIQRQNNETIKRWIWNLCSFRFTRGTPHSIWLGMLHFLWSRIWCESQRAHRMNINELNNSLFALCVKERQNSASVLVLAHLTFAGVKCKEKLKFCRCNYV